MVAAVRAVAYMVRQSNSFAEQKCSSCWYKMSVLLLMHGYNMRVTVRCFVVYDRYEGPKYRFIQLHRSLSFVRPVDRALKLMYRGMHEFC